LTIEQMRASIMAVYGGTWPYRVRMMSARQVIAIYYSFKKRGLIK
jgi:hypothetical protein